MKIVLLALPLLVSCGVDSQQIQIKTGPNPQTFSGDPYIAPEAEDLGLIVSEFYASASWLKKPVSREIKRIYFVDSMPDYTVGLCYIYTYSDGRPYFREIQMLKSFWDAASPQTKRVLVYHELGHCALNQAHEPVDSFKIMEPYVLTDEVSSPRWYSLVKDLFQDQSLSLLDKQPSNDDVIVNYLD